MNFHSTEISFRYEQLARFTFNKCKKKKDPWQSASQEFYDGNFIYRITPRGRKILHIILAKLILDYQNTKIFKSLIEISELIFTAKKQIDVILIIENTIEQLELIGI